MEKGAHEQYAMPVRPWPSTNVCVCVGMDSQACQADGVFNLGQEDRCSIAAWLE